MSTDSLPSTGKWDTGGKIPSDPDRCPDCGSNSARPAVRLRDDEWGAGPMRLMEGSSAEKVSFNDLHISHLPQKVDGITEHLFVAILNGEAVGSAIAKMQEWKACAVHELFVTPKHRHTGIATRLMREVEAFARREKATQLELCVIKANTPARQFWIHRCKFIDDIVRQADGPRASEYVCMVKEL